MRLKLFFLIQLLIIILILAQCLTQPTVLTQPRMDVIATGLLSPVGMTILPDGQLLIAEAGRGENDNSAGITLITPDGQIGRLISGLPSTRNSGDLAGTMLVALSPDQQTIYLGSFGQGHLWTLPVSLAQTVPAQPYTPADLQPAMRPLNKVRLINPYDLTFDPQGQPVVSDATGNGIAIQNADGSTRFIHRFDPLPNPLMVGESATIDPVPTGLTRVGERYFVTLTGGCPYPAGAGQVVAVSENRQQETIIGGLNMPLDIAPGPDESLWLLEFAHFDPAASCFSGAGYQPHTGRLSRLSAAGLLTPILTDLDYPGSILPLADGSLYLTEIFSGQLLHLRFDAEQMPPLALTEPLQADAPPLETSTLRFTDVAAGVGLHFQHGAFQTGIFPDPVAMMGGGLCWLDYNNDNWLDLYVINSYAEAETDYWAEQGGLPTNALYRNDEGSFTDVRQASRTDLTLRGNGCVAADFNRDGWLDIYVTVDGPNALLINNGDGTFTESAALAGVAAPEWNSAAAVADLNRDGWPDLFVAAYIDLTKTVPKPVGAFPQDYYGLPDHVYLNQGNHAGKLTFKDVTAAVGLTREERGLGALFSDLDADGNLELYIANDGHPNRLYTTALIPDDPAGIGFHFTDLTETADVGDSGSGMGIAGGDYDGDGWLDLFVTNWQKELNALYHNEIAETEALTFQYSTFRIGISGLGNEQTGWGTHLVDFDHDTDEDMLVVNGMVPISDLVADRQLTRLYRNQTVNPHNEPRPAQFLDATQEVGLEDVGPLMARGSAAADFDNDGDIDLAINTIAGPLVLLQNSGVTGNWLQIQFDSFQPGARATLTLPDGRHLVREVYAGSSYLASEDLRLHFGVGTATQIPRVVIHWPDGMERVIEDVAVNQVLVMRR